MSGCCHLINPVSCTILQKEGITFKLSVLSFVLILTTLSIANAEYHPHHNITKESGYISAGGYVFLNQLDCEDFVKGKKPIEYFEKTGRVAQPPTKTYITIINAVNIGNRGTCYKVYYYDSTYYPPQVVIWSNSVIKNKSHLPIMRNIP